MPLVINGATSGSTTIQATDAVTATITLPSATGTVQLANSALNGSLGATTPSTVVATTINASGAITQTGANDLTVGQYLKLGDSNGVVFGAGVQTAIIGNQSLQNIDTYINSVLITRHSSTGLRVTNTVGVGGTTPSTSGAGITFPATQSASTDANTLDDYEEGTWTPTQGSGLTVVGAFSSSGTYTKIGRQVTVTFSVAGATSVAVSAGAIICNGLPFTTNASGAYGVATNAVSTAVTIAQAFSSSVYSSISITANAGIYSTVTYFV